MTRTILAAAAAFLAASTLMADPARACISCEYTPEVVRENPSSRHAGKSRVVARAAVYHQRRAAKPQIAQPRRPVAKKVRVAKAVAPSVSPKARTQEITTGSVQPTAATADSKDVATRATAPATSATAGQTSTVLLSQQTRTAEAAAPAKALGCKKFLPAVGVTVDCK